jgi:hypothetical protein
MLDEPEEVKNIGMLDEFEDVCRFNILILITNKLMSFYANNQGENKSVVINGGA